MSVKERPQGKKDLIDDEEISLERILAKLIEVGKDDRDLDLKTDILNPEALAILWTYSIVLNDEKLTKSSEFIQEVITTLKRYRPSKDGKRASDIIKAVSSLLDKEAIRMSLSERLTANMKQ